MPPRKYTKKSVAAAAADADVVAATSVDDVAVVAADAPSVIKVRGGTQDLTKTTRNPRAKKSTFHLTINSNQQYKDGDPNLENDISVFEDTIADILKHIDEYVRLPDGDDFHSKVQDADIDFVVERGTKKGQIHTHILLRFKHSTRLQLDYDKIKAKLKQELGVDCYMYNRLVKNSETSNVEDYLAKYL